MLEAEFPNFKKIHDDQPKEMGTELKIILNDIVKKTEVSGKFSNEIESIKLISYQLKIIDALSAKLANSTTNSGDVLSDIEMYLVDEIQTLNREYESYNTALSNFRRNMHRAIENHKRRVALVKNQIAFCGDLKENILHLEDDQKNIESIKKILNEASDSVRALATKYINVNVVDQLENGVSDSNVIPDKRFINNN